MLKLRVALVGAALLLASSAAGYALATNVQPAFVASGTTRYAMVAAEDPQTTTSTTFVNIPNLSSSVSIPSGKVADVMINFSSEMNGCSAITVRAVIDGGTTAPTSAQVFWPLNGGADSHGFTFFKKGLRSGNHTVAMQWEELTSCSQAFIASRSMVITANIH